MASGRSIIERAVEKSLGESFMPAQGGGDVSRPAPEGNGVQTKIKEKSSIERAMERKENQHKDMQPS